MIRDSQERTHQRLDVWRDVMTLAETVHRHTGDFPETERFGSTAQIRRAAVSVPSNIAEGAARRSTSDYLRFLSIARGSLAELDTQLQLAQRSKLLTLDQTFSDLVDRTYARLNALIRALDTSPRSVREESPAYESPIPNPESHAG